MNRDQDGGSASYRAAWRWSGAGAAASRRNGAGVDGTEQDGGGPGQTPGRRHHPERRARGVLAAVEGGGGVRVDPDPEAAGAGSRAPAGDDEPGQRGRGAGPRHDPLPGGVGAADRRASEAHDRGAARAGHLDGPGRGQCRGRGARDAASLAGAFDSRAATPSTGWHLRRRLQLRLPEQLVGQPHDADAARDEPAPRLRAAVRGRGEHERRGAPGEREAAAEHSRPRAGQGRRPQGGSGALRRAEARRVPGGRPQHRAAHPARRAAGRPAVAGGLVPGRDSGVLRGARAADVRPDGAGLSDRHDPRDLADDGPRGERRDVSADRGHRAAPPPQPPPGHPGEDREAGEDQRVPHEAVQRGSWSRCRRRRTATGRCSTTS